jgi:hypothetical protein
VIRRLPAGPHHERLLTAASCDNLILYPGLSRARDRRERGRWKHKRKGSNAALICITNFLLLTIFLLWLVANLGASAMAEKVGFPQDLSKYRYMHSVISFVGTTKRKP